jgi:hypothetical protein
MPTCDFFSLASGKLIKYTRKQGQKMNEKGAGELPRKEKRSSNYYLDLPNTH